MNPTYADQPVEFTDREQLYEFLLKAKRAIADAEDALIDAYESPFVLDDDNQRILSDLCTDLDELYTTLEDVADRVAVMDDEPQEE